MARVEDLVEHHDPQYTSSDLDHHEKIDMSDARVMELKRSFLSEGYDPGQGLIDLGIESDGVTWIIEGNHRAAAALEAGIDEMPVHLCQAPAELPHWLREVELAQIPEIIRPTMSSQQMIRRLARSHPDEGAEHGVEPPTLSRMQAAGNVYERTVMDPSRIDCDWSADPATVEAICTAIDLGHEIEPIVVDSVTDHVIDGANRLAAARQMGLDEIPVWRSAFARPELSNRAGELPAPTIENDAAHRHIS
jgi:hypothetical protein